VDERRQPDSSTGHADTSAWRVNGADDLISGAENQRWSSAGAALEPAPEPLALLATGQVGEQARHRQPYAPGLDDETPPSGVPAVEPPLWREASRHTHRSSSYAPPLGEYGSAPVAERPPPGSGHREPPAGPGWPTGPAADEVAARAAGLPQRVPAEPDVPISAGESGGQSLAEPVTAREAWTAPELAFIADQLRRDDVPREALTGSFDVDEVVAAVREVPGVEEASVRTNSTGMHTLRLDLSDDADPGQVSRAVARLLLERMGLSASPQGVPQFPAPEEDFGSGGPAAGAGSGGAEPLAGGVPGSSAGPPVPLAGPPVPPAGSAGSPAGPALEPVTGPPVNSSGRRLGLGSPPDAPPESSGAVDPWAPPADAEGWTPPASADAWAPPAARTAPDQSLPPEAAPWEPAPPESDLPDPARAPEPGPAPGSGPGPGPGPGSGPGPGAGPDLDTAPEPPTYPTVPSQARGAPDGWRYEGLDDFVSSLPDEPVPEPVSRPLHSAQPGPRVVIDQVQVRTFGLEATVEVLLTAGDRQATGVARGPAVDSYLVRLAAVAAAKAIDSLLRGAADPSGPSRCFVEHTGVVAFGNAEVAVVVLLLVCGGWVEQLTGSALVDGDPRQAMVRATLGAVNRRLEALLA
jgi:hypothetical protein